jgi:hypothetical protein
MRPRQVAERLEISVATLYRYEGGQVALRSVEVENMCRLYGASAEMTEALMGLAKEAKTRGWWHAYGDAIPRWFQVYVGLETAASHLRKFEPDLIPGLLQTKDYATAILRLDEVKTPVDEIEKRVKVRLERQALLFRRIPPAPQLDVILGEVALRRSLNDRGAMAEQLRHVNEIGQLANVTVRVLPLSVGLYRGAGISAFTILEFPSNGNGRESEPPTVYAGSLTGALYLDREKEVEAYGAMWADVTAISLDESESRQLIAEIAEEYGGS